MKTHQVGVGGRHIDSVLVRALIWYRHLTTHDAVRGQHHISLGQPTATDNIHTMHRSECDIQIRTAQKSRQNNIRQRTAQNMELSVNTSLISIYKWEF